MSDLESRVTLRKTRSKVDFLFVKLQYENGCGKVLEILMEKERDLSHGAPGDALRRARSLVDKHIAVLFLDFKHMGAACDTIKRIDQLIDKERDLVDSILYAQQGEDAVYKSVPLATVV